MAMVRSVFRELAKAAARAAAEKKAVDLVLLDVRQESDLADYILLASADSSVQMRAVSESVSDHLAESGVRLIHREGRARDRWMALDYGGLVVHVLMAEARAFYRLDSLWEKAKPVKWSST
jgi:ribosome-associated protein